MRKIEVEQNFDYTLKEVLRVREYCHEHPELFPEFHSMETISERQEGSKIYQVRHLHLQLSLPELLVTLIPMDVCTFIENSTFDKKSNKHEYVIMLPDSYSFIMTIKGYSVYHSLGKGRSKRSLSVEISSGVFLISQLVEYAIGELYAKSIQHSYDAMIKYMPDANPQ